MRIAGFSPAVHCEDEELSSYFERELAAFKGGAGGDLLLRFELVRSPALDGMMPPACTHLAPAPSVDIWFSREAAPDSLTLRVQVARDQDGSLADDGFLNSLLLNMMVSHYLQHLSESGRAEICSVHACGAALDGKAVLFAGPSGAGKSTLARKLQEDRSCRLLGDDMIPLTRSGSGWVAHGSPLGGDIPRSSLANVSAPLQVIYLLSQGTETCWSMLDAAESIASLLSCVVPAREPRFNVRQSIGEYDRESLDCLMGDASRLAEDVPCYALSMALGQQPWERIFQTRGEADR